MLAKILSVQAAGSFSVWADVGSLSPVSYPASQVLSILCDWTFEYLAPASRQGSLVLLAEILSWRIALFRLGAGWSDAVHRDPLTEVRQLDPPPARQEGEDSNQGPEAAARNKMRKSVSRRLPGKHWVNGKRFRSIKFILPQLIVILILPMFRLEYLFLSPKSRQNYGYHGKGPTKATPYFFHLSRSN